MAESDIMRNLERVLTNLSRALRAVSHR
jgi:hypothetical protein